MKRKKELTLALTAWHSDTIRKFKNTQGFGCGGRRREQVHPSPLLCSPSLPPCTRGRLIMYKHFWLRLREAVVKLVLKGQDCSKHL